VSAPLSSLQAWPTSDKVTVRSRMPIALVMDDPFLCFRPQTDTCSILKVAPVPVKIDCESRNNMYDPVKSA
jgi:hypothetical protein